MATPPLPPPPRRSPTPPRRSPTPPTATPPSLMTKRKPAPKRSAPQTKSLSHQPTKKKASSNPVILQKLSYEKSEKELNAAVQKNVDSFFEKVKKQREARENPEKPYFYLPPDLLRKKVARKSGNLKRPCQNRTTTALSPSHLRRRRKRLDQGKVLHNSDNNRNNQSPLLSFVMNMVHI